MLADLFIGAPAKKKKKKSDFLIEKFLVAEHSAWVLRADWTISCSVHRLLVSNLFSGPSLFLALAIADIGGPEPIQDYLEWRLSNVVPSQQISIT